MNKQELHAFVAKQQPNICQIVAYRSGKKVYSDCWNDYKEDDCVHIMSATKSIMALLIGIALDKGQIGSIDDKILDYFPDYKVKRGEKTIQNVTIRHLLTMRAPYKCKGDPWTKVCSSDNRKDTESKHLVRRSRRSGNSGLRSVHVRGGYGKNRSAVSE